MNSKFHPDFKLFGMSLDPSDDPWSLELKHAWMSRPEKELECLAACLDPYDALNHHLRGILTSRHIEPAGKFALPTWLTPKPEAMDAPLVNSTNIGEFYDSDGLTQMVQQLKGFVEDSIFPSCPVMAGVDHTATLGVLSALSHKYGPENLSVIVLDQHFDAIPMSVRVEEAGNVAASSQGGLPLTSLTLPENYQDQCCCGNFWAYLLDAGTIRPENLALIGVVDYPQSGQDSPFGKYYLEYEKRGCRFFPLQRFNGQYQDELSAFLQEGIKTSHLYVSLDIDVGSYNFTWAARYMDRTGINQQNLLDVAALLQQSCQRLSVDLVGFDIMEFNMHFLGLETGNGKPDTTLETIGEFIKALLPP